MEVVRDRRAAVGGEDVAGDHAAVARVEEGDVARGCGRGSGRPRGCRRGRRRASRTSGPVRSFGQLPGSLPSTTFSPAWIRASSSGISTSHRVAEPLLQRVERADVVAVAVRQRDPADRSAGRGRGGDQRVGGAAERRVDEREAVVLADEVGVDEAQPGELDQVGGERSWSS